MYHFHYKHLQILKLLKSNKQDIYILSEIVKLLKKEKIKMSKPTLLKYMDLFCALSFFKKIKSFIVYYNSNWEYEGWNKI